MDLSAALKTIGNSIEALDDILVLFDHIPNTFFYIKDRNYRILWGNKAFCEYLGEESVAGLVGKGNADYFSSELAFLYDRDDDEVTTSQCPHFKRPWIIPDRSGHPKWFVSTKIPLINKSGKTEAFAGIIQNLVHDFEITQQFGEMHTVVEHIFTHYRERLSVETLASLAFLSLRQFDRRFQRLFHQTPKEFIQKVRIDASLRLLMESDLSITQIALECGFFDNSHFSRQFKEKMGLSPIQFRKKFFDTNRYLDR